MKKKDFSKLSLEELKNTSVQIDYEKPGFHAIGGSVPGGCRNGNFNSGWDGCIDGFCNTGVLLS